MMNAQLVMLLLFAIALRSNDCTLHGNTNVKCPDSLLSEMCRGYKIKRIAAEAILGKKRQNHQDIICIKKIDKQDIQYAASRIEVYTGGGDGFAWKIKNTLHVYDAKQSKQYDWDLSEFNDIYDVILAMNNAYLYCRDEKNQEILCRLNLPSMKSKQHTFKSNRQCTILDDDYCRYVTACNKYSLIEGLPQYSPSLLVSNFPVRKTIGIFYYQLSDKHIAMSHNLRQYVVHTQERFLHYNYESMEYNFYDIEKETFEELELNKILFAATDDVLILQGKKKLLLISFEEKKHWVTTNGKKIIKIFPHVESGKTLIQTKRGNFGYLEYAHETNEFKIIPI